jgi:hypothetical protein
MRENPLRFHPEEIRTYYNNSFTPPTIPHRTRHPASFPSRSRGWKPGGEHPGQDITRRNT